MPLPFFCMLPECQPFMTGLTAATKIIIYEKKGYASQRSYSTGSRSL